MLGPASGITRLEPTTAAPPVVAMVSLWPGTCCCCFPHHSVHAAAAAEQAARLAVGLTPLIYKPAVDEVVSVGIQRLQENKTWRLWVWPPAAKKFVNEKEFR